MNDAVHSDFCRTSEKMLAELGYEQTIPDLTARVAGARLAYERVALDLLKNALVAT